MNLWKLKIKKKHTHNKNRNSSFFVHDNSGRKRIVFIAIFMIRLNCNQTTARSRNSLSKLIKFKILCLEHRFKTKLCYGIRSRTEV